MTSELMDKFFPGKSVKTSKKKNLKMIFPCETQ